MKMCLATDIINHHGSTTNTGATLTAVISGDTTNTDEDTIKQY